MKKILMLLSGMMVMAVYAVASAPAMAADPECGAEKPNSNLYCLAFALLGAETELELIKTAVFLLTQENGEPHKFVIETATPTEVTCTAGSGEATAEESGTTTVVKKGVVTFTGCTIGSANKAECVVDETITTKEIEGTMSLQSEEEVAGKPENRVDLLLKAPSGVFAEFTIKSKEGFTCTQAVSKGKVKGEELCYWLATNLATDELLHLLQCVPGGLTFALTNSALTVEFEALLLSANGAAQEDDNWSLKETEV